MPPLIRQQLPRPIVPREECETDNHNQSHAQVARKTFSLKPVVVDCHPSTTLEDFASALLLQPQQPPLNTPGRSASPFARTDYFALSSRSHSNHRASVPLSPLASLPSPQIAHFVIAKNLDRAPRVVQIQALELLRTRRIFTRTSVQAAPKQFVFIPVVGAASGGEAHVTPHLNDFFSIAHWHNPDDGYVNLDESEGRNNDPESETASTESVVKKASDDSTPSTALISDIVSSYMSGLLFCHNLNKHLYRKLANSQS